MIKSTPDQKEMRTEDAASKFWTSSKLRVNKCKAEDGGGGRVGSEKPEEQLIKGLHLEQLNKASKHPTNTTQACRLANILVPFSFW